MTKPISALPPAAGMNNPAPADDAHAADCLLGNVRQRELSFDITRAPEWPAAQAAAPSVASHAAIDDVVTDSGLKRQLTQAFFKTADFIRNDQGAPHDQHHPNPVRPA